MPRTFFDAATSADVRWYWAHTEVSVRWGGLWSLGVIFTVDKSFSARIFLVSFLQKCFSVFVYTSRFHSQIFREEKIVGSVSPTPNTPNTSSERIYHKPVLNGFLAWRNTLFVTLQHNFFLESSDLVNRIPPLTALRKAASESSWFYIEFDRREEKNAAIKTKHAT